MRVSVNNYKQTHLDNYIKEQGKLGRYQRQLPAQLYNVSTSNERKLIGDDSRFYRPGWRLAFCCYVWLILLVSYSLVLSACCRSRRQTCSGCKQGFQVFLQIYY